MVETDVKIGKLINRMEVTLTDRTDLGVAKLIDRKQASAMTFSSIRPEPTFSPPGTQDHMKIALLTAIRSSTRTSA